MGLRDYVGYSYLSSSKILRSAHWFLANGSGVLEIEFSSANESYSHVVEGWSLGARGTVSVHFVDERG